MYNPLNQNRRIYTLSEDVVLVGAKGTAKWSPPFFYFTKTILLFSTDESKDIYVTKYKFKINASLFNFLSVKLL